MSNLFEAGVRLVVEGGALVKTTFNEIAASGKKMWAEIAVGEAAGNAALKGVSAGVNEAKLGIQGLASEAGGLGRVFGAMGAAGVAAAAVIGAAFLAAKFAVDKARGGMADALEIDNASKKLQISADSLQEWRFVAQEATGDGKNFDTALAALEDSIGKVTGKIGRFKIVAAAFKELGIPPETLGSYRDAEDLIAVVSEKFQGLDQNKRKALADKLGLGPILPVLVEGTKKIADLKEEANRLGLVMANSTVKEMAELERHTKLASEVIDHNLKMAFIGLAPVIAEVVGWLAQASGKLDDFIEKFKSLSDRSEHAISDQIDELLQHRADLVANQKRAKAGDILYLAAAGVSTVAGQGGYDEAIKKTDARLALLGTEYAKRGAQDDADRAKFNPVTDTGGDAKTKGGSATAANDRLQRANDEVEEAELKGIDARIKLAHDAKTKLDLELERISREALKRDADLDSQARDYLLSKGKKGISPDERSRIGAANADVNTANRQEAQQRYDDAVRELAQKEQTYQLELKLKEAQAGGDKEAEQSLNAQLDLVRRIAEIREHLIDIGVASSDADNLSRLNAAFQVQAIGAARTTADLQLSYHAATADQPAGVRNDLVSTDQQMAAEQKGNDEVDAERIKKISDEVGHAFESGIEGALKGEKLKKVLGEFFLKGAEGAFDNIGKSLTSGLLNAGRDGNAGQAGSWIASLLGVNHQALPQPGTSGAPGAPSSWFSGIENFFGFGGGHAAGGDLHSGMRYDVGEGGRPELAMVGAGGSMFSQDQTANILRNAVGATSGARQQPSNLTMNSHYHVDGYVSDRDLDAKLGALHRQTVADTLAAVREKLPEMQTTFQELKN